MLLLHFYDTEREYGKDSRVVNRDERRIFGIFELKRLK